MLRQVNMVLLQSYKELKFHFPLLPAQRLFIDESRDTIRAILNGIDPRLLLIVGPCSIHDKLSAIDFAHHLRELATSVSSHFYLVMRVYCEKPRTASGWKGFLYDPLLDGSNAMHHGIEWTRQLLLELAALEVPTATEFLDPLTAFYYDDLITWGSIGARTSSSQTHRQLASNLSMPIGFKNGIAGNVSAAIHGAMAASEPHTYMGLCENGKPTIMKTNGNPDAHIVLRGGESGSNYDSSSIARTLISCEQIKLKPKLLIDCSHQNSGKKYERQLEVFQCVVQQIIEGNTHIRGLMLESHLKAGRQTLSKDLSNLQYGMSITDPCLDWPSTAHLIQWGVQILQQQLAAQTVHSCNCLIREVS